jgi:hypothetical protein
MNNNKMKRTLALASALSLLCLGGCHLGRTASASFAAIEIQDRTPEQIRDAAVAVFREEGYAVASADPGHLVFEKEGTQGNKLAYGAIDNGPPVWVRLKAAIVPLSAGLSRLQCNAFMVRNKEDPFFAEEIRLKNFRSGPYQTLLDRVAERLK